LLSRFILFCFVLFYLFSEPDAVSDSIVNDMRVDDDQLSQMLTTLMGEASQIRGTQPSTKTS
jgi:hypothetical protein